MTDLVSPSPDRWARYEELKLKPWNEGLEIIEAVDAARAADAAAHAEDLRRKDETITLLMGKVEDLKVAHAEEIQRLTAQLDEAQQRIAAVERG